MNCRSMWSLVSPTAGRLADGLLEATVVGSWTSLGYRARAALFDWHDPAPDALHGTTALVTGGTSGIGRASAEALAALGASVVIVGRDPARTAEAGREIAECSGGAVLGEAADMSSLADVRSLAARVRDRTDRLSVLVHGAGQLSHHYSRTKDGLERTAATQVVGPHLLTAELVPLLRRGAPASVVFVSSGGMYGAPLSVARLDPNPATYRGAAAYAAAKRAQVALADEWDTRLRDHGVRVRSMHPGWVDSTALRSGLPRFATLMRPLLRTPAQGADTIVWLATQPGAPAGFYLDRRARRTALLPGGVASSPAESAALWRWCEDATMSAGGPE